MPKSTTWITTIERVDLKHSKLVLELTIDSFCTWSSYQEIIRLDISIDQVFLMNGLHTSYLWRKFDSDRAQINGMLTICRAARHTVLIENFLPHISNRSSRLGPRRSITR